MTIWLTVVAILLLWFGGVAINLHVPWRILVVVNSVSVGIALVIAAVVATTEGWEIPSGILVGIAAYLAMRTVVAGRARTRS